MHDMSPEQAQSALDRAAESASRVRSRASSPRTYSLVNASAWAASLLAYGLIEPVAIRLTAWGAILTLSLGGVVIWIRLRPAQQLPVPPPRGGYKVYTLSMCAIEIAAILVGGFAGWQGEPAFWIPAAIAVAIPLTVLAVRVPTK